MTHFTATVRDDWTIELPEEARHIAKPGQRVDIAVDNAQSAAPSSNLLEYLGDFVGGVEGTGANNSDDTGSKFADHLVKKHIEGHL